MANQTPTQNQDPQRGQNRDPGFQNMDPESEQRDIARQGAKAGSEERERSDIEQERSPDQERSQQAGGSGRTSTERSGSFTRGGDDDEELNPSDGSSDGIRGGQQGSRGNERMDRNEGRSPRQ